jgi:hypothetical protein
MPISKLTSLPFPPPAVPPFSASGQGLIASVNQLIDTSVASLKSLTATPQTDTVYNVIGFYAGSSVGGGQIVYRPDVSKSLHNGGTIIAPEAIATWDGTNENLSALLSWTGSGTGCFVRLESPAYYNVETFGGLPSPALCTESMQKLIDTYGFFVGVPNREYTIRRVFLTRPVYIDLNQCTIRGDVFTTSGFRADGISGIYIKNGNFVHTKTIGVYVQAITLWNCQNITLENLTIDGFSQFSINITHTIDGVYSGFKLDRVKVTNGGNFFADPSAIANCMEFFSSNSSAIRTDTLITDCEFSLMPDAKGNVAKFGLCRDTQVVRSKFSSLRATFVGSSGIQSGSNNNPLNGENRVTLQDCEINCVDTTDGYYAYDGTGWQTFIRSKITGNGGSIYVPPKGAQTQKWIFIDSNIVDKLTYDNPIHEIEELSLTNSYIKTLELSKDNSNPAACIVRNLTIKDSVVDTLQIGVVSIDNLTISGAKSSLTTLSIFNADTIIGDILIFDKATLGDVTYTTATGSVYSIIIDGARINRLAIRNNNLSSLVVRNSDLFVGGSLDWYMGAIDTCVFSNNTIKENPDNPPTTATNVLLLTMASL